MSRLLSASARVTGGRLKAFLPSIAIVLGEIANQEGPRDGRRSKVSATRCADADAIEMDATFNS